MRIRLHSFILFYIVGTYATTPVTWIETKLTLRCGTPASDVRQLVDSVVAGWHTSWHNVAALCWLRGKCQNGDVVIDGCRIVTFVFSHLGDCHALSNVLTQSHLSNFDSKIICVSERPKR